MLARNSLSTWGWDNKKCRQISGLDLSLPLPWLWEMGWPVDNTSLITPINGVLEHLDKRIGDGGVICFAETLLPITKGINAIPLGLL